MIDVMDLKGLSPGTKDNCLRRVSALARFCDHAPATLSVEKVGAWVPRRIDGDVTGRRWSIR